MIPLVAREALDPQVVRVTAAMRCTEAASISGIPAVHLLLVDHPATRYGPGGGAPSLGVGPLRVSDCDSHGWYTWRGYHAEVRDYS